MGTPLPAAMLEDSYNTGEKVSNITALLDGMTMHLNKIKHTAEAFESEQLSQDQ